MMIKIKINRINILKLIKKKWKIKIICPNINLNRIRIYLISKIIFNHNYKILNKNKKLFHLKELRGRSLGHLRDNLLRGEAPPLKR